MKPLSRKPLSEHQIQALILDWLKLKGIFHYRQNSGGMKKGKHFLKFGAKGAPDIVCVVKGQYVGIEVKGPKGSMTLGQVFFGHQLTCAGGLYLIASTLEDVTKVLG